MKTQSKDGKLMVLRRPIQKLYPLEVRDTDIQRPSSAVEEPSSSEKIVNSTENLTEKLVNPAVKVDESVNVAEGSIQPLSAHGPNKMQPNELGKELLPGSRTYTARNIEMLIYC